MHIFCPWKWRRLETLIDTLLRIFFGKSFLPLWRSEESWNRVPERYRKWKEKIEIQTALKPCLVLSLRENTKFASLTKEIAKQNSCRYRAAALPAGTDNRWCGTKSCRNELKRSRRPRNIREYWTLYPCSFTKVPGHFAASLWEAAQAVAPRLSLRVSQPGPSFRKDFLALSGMVQQYLVLHFFWKSLPWKILNVLV